MSINSANYPYIDRKARKRAIRRKSYLKNRQKEIDKAVASNKIRKRLVKKHIGQVKLNSKCGFCDCDIPDCLDFHHVRGEEKRFTINEAVAGNYGMKSTIKELEKCITLCSNHHRVLHAALRMKDYNTDLLKKLLEF